MARKYPQKMFWFFVMTNFLFHFFYLSLPGGILCVAGIWNSSCLRVGLALLALDFVMSIFEQLRIRRAAISESDNPEYNALMDAFFQEGPDAFREMVESKINAPQNHNDCP